MRIAKLMMLLMCANALAADGAPIRPTLTNIQADCEILGLDWSDEYGIRIDDWSKLSRLSNAEREVAGTLKKQLQPLGIASAADYSCARSEAPLDVVTVRVFVFENQQRASDWWRKKYEYENWEQHYAKVTGAEFSTVDSKQMVKRAILFGNIWITTHHIREGQEHLALLESILEQLRAS